MTARLTFGFHDLAVRLEALSSSTVDWLREFIGPDFDERPNAAATHVVRLHEDGDRYDALRRAGPHPSGQALQCFALDHSVEWLPRWNAAGDAAVLFDSALRLFYRRVPECTVFDVFSPAHNLSHRIALLRIVRELAMAHLTGPRAEILHGAALSWQERGYVFAGPKRAGKTTLLLHALSGTGARYVANDRVIAEVSAPGVSIKGLPTIVTIRPSSLDLLPLLRARFHDTRYHHRHTIDEADRLAAPTSARVEGQSVDLTPAQLVRLLRAERTGRVQLAAVVFPKHTGQRSGVVIHRLSRQQTRERIRESLFRSQSSTCVGEFFSGGPQTGNASIRDAACTELANNIIGLECALGLDAYDEPQSARDLLRGLERYSSD